MEQVFKIKLEIILDQLSEEAYKNFVKTYPTDADNEFSKWNCYDPGVLFNWLEFKTTEDAMAWLLIWA